MMPRTLSPLLIRVCVTSACGAVLLLEGGLGGWLVRNEHPGATLDLVAMAAFSCVPVVLGMLFVRGVFKARSVRILFDVLAILIWALMVAAISELFTRGAPAYSGEGVLLTPIFSIGLTFAAVLLASAVGVSLWLWGHFKKSHYD